MDWLWLQSLRTEFVAVNVKTSKTFIIHRIESLQKDFFVVCSRFCVSGL